MTGQGLQRKPCLDREMLSTPGDIIHQECSCSASVIRPGDGSERLLACLSSSISPNLSELARSTLQAVSAPHRKNEFRAVTPTVSHI